MAPAALHRPLAADAAELVASVPVDLGPALGQDACFGERELHGGRARLFEPPRVVQIELVARVTKLGDIDGEMRHALQLPEEDGRDVDLQARDLRCGQPPEARFRRGMDQHIELPEWQKPSSSVDGLRIQPLLIPTLRVTTVKWVASKDM
jgi:hypothetical protein